MDCEEEVWMLEAWPEGDHFICLFNHMPDEEIIRKALELDVGAPVTMIDEQYTWVYRWLHRNGQPCTAELGMQMTISEQEWLDHADK